MFAEDEYGKINSTKKFDSSNSEREAVSKVTGGLEGDEYCTGPECPIMNQTPIPSLPKSNRTFKTVEF